MTKQDFDEITSQYKLMDLLAENSTNQIIILMPIKSAHNDKPPNQHTQSKRKFHKFKL